MPDTAAVFAQHGEKLLYKVPEAAAMLGFGTSKTWELVARGELRSVKIDRSRRITRDALVDYIAHLQAAGDA